MTDEQKQKMKDYQKKFRENKCFLCFNKYKVVKKGWVKCTFVF